MNISGESLPYKWETLFSGVEGATFHSIFMFRIKRTQYASFLRHILKFMVRYSKYIIPYRKAHFNI